MVMCNKVSPESSMVKLSNSWNIGCYNCKKELEVATNNEFLSITTPVCI